MKLKTHFLHYYIILYLKSINSKHNFKTLKKSIQKNYNKKTQYY